MCPLNHENVRVYFSHNSEKTSSMDFLSTQRAHYVRACTHVRISEQFVVEISRPAALLFGSLSSLRFVRAPYANCFA